MDPASAATVDGDKEIGRCRFELCQGGGAKSPRSRPGAETKRNRDDGFLRGQLIYDGHYCAIIYQIRKGSGSEGRELGEVGARSFVGSIHGRALCGLWFVNEQEGLVRMRRCDIEPCPLFFSLRTLFSSATGSACLPSPPNPPCLAFSLP